MYGEQSTDHIYGYSAYYPTLSTRCHKLRLHSISIWQY